MRGIIIIVEGQTEEEFVNNLLYEYLLAQGISDVRPIKIQTSPGHKGGLTDYTRYRRDATNYLKRENDILVTSLIDYFRLPKDFPGYDEARKSVGAINKVAFLENALRDDINHHRFIPYIQLHEFEGLLFADSKGFDLITDLPSLGKISLNKILDDFPNPEMINDGAETAPSKRLIKIIPGYEKAFHGPIIALENGIDSIIAKCPRFKVWLETLIQKMKS